MLSDVRAGSPKIEILLSCNIYGKISQQLQDRLKE